MPARCAPACPTACAARRFAVVLPVVFNLDEE
jgi:hypothetical protein